jgi:two-component system, OmpR family, phosphate regulon sensor histidine kinase PhoR
MTRGIRTYWRYGRELEPAVAAKRRVQAALAVLIMLLAALLATGIYSTFALYRSAENRYIHLLFPLRTHSRDLVLQMVNEEVGVRGYMISRDRSSLHPYFAGRAGVKVDLSEIERLTAGRPDLQGQLQPLRRDIRRLHGYFDREITFVADGQLGQQRARAEVLKGEPLFESFRTNAAALQTEITRFVDRTRDDQRRTLAKAVGFLGASGLLAILIAMFLIRLVPERLRQLYAAEEQARIRAERDANAARALAHVSDAVVLVDGDTCIRSWNPAAGELFGISGDDALGHKAATVVPELAGISSGLRPFSIDGEERWLAVAVSPFDDGRVLTLRDVTAERMLERARADFVTTASHELRTPLTAIYGGVRTLLGRVDTLDTAKRHRLLQMIEQESEHLSQIVEQLLVTAELDRGRLRLTSNECDLTALCTSVLDAAETRKPESVRLALVASPGVPPLHCDEIRLRQVLVNLIENAIKYSPSGGRVEVRLADELDQAKIEVRDEGLGIPPSEQGRIFEKFYRLDAEMTRGIGGSGLGLYISREIVEQMGGNLSVSSVPGVGSTFVVTLPRSREGAQLMHA